MKIFSDMVAKPVISHLEEMTTAASVRALQNARSCAPKAALVFPKEHMNPAERSAICDQTYKLALKQTIAARAVLYHPSYTVRKELADAASALHKVVTQLKPADQKTLGARLLGAEGLMAGKSPQDIVAVLARVKGDSRHPVANIARDRAVVIALMGDIGALYADAPANVEGRGKDPAEKLRKTLVDLLGKQGLSLEPATTVPRVQMRGGSNAVGPLKKEERSRSKAELKPRTGIHNLGSEADHLLQISEKRRIPPTTWGVSHISGHRVGEMKEPLAGHMSGSLAEILQVWDMLAGVKSDLQFSGVLDTWQKKQGEISELSKKEPKAWDPLAHHEDPDCLRARAAAASAFLVGLGYHSAVEVVEGTLAYLGQDLRSSLPEHLEGKGDAGHVMGDNAATKILKDLFKDQSVNKPPVPPKSPALEWLWMLQNLSY